MYRNHTGVQCRVECRGHFGLELEINFVVVFRAKSLN